MRKPAEKVKTFLAGFLGWNKSRMPFDCRLQSTGADSTVNVHEITV